MEAVAAPDGPASATPSSKNLLPPGQVVGSTGVSVIMRTSENGRGHAVNLNSFAAPEMFAINEQDMEPSGIDHCWSQFVMTEKNPVRIAWSILIFIMLAYIASVYLYRFSFCSFHIGPNGPDPIGDDDMGWIAIDAIVDITFWIDLVLNFFFTYKNDRGLEVDSMRMIAIKYMRGLFWVNLIACLPEAFGEVVIKTFRSIDAGDRFDFRVARLSRLQRISRLTRLMRLTRLLRCFTSKSKSPFVRWFQSLRGVRIVNFFFGLVWSVHLLACGWYLCAALHGDVLETWVARRAMDVSGTSLLEAGPPEQWIHSMYFVLTVFTTVGFGDISAGTEMEIVYVAFTMLAGAVVHSIIISEVIQVVTSTDRIHEITEKHLDLVEAFCEHTHLPYKTQAIMKEEIQYRVRNFVSSFNINKEEMKDLITGKHVPRWLLGALPSQLYEGKLLKNELFRGNLYMPPRLPCLLAVHLAVTEFDGGEIVYQMHDFPFNLFLVLRGTFGYIGMPAERGGIDMSCEGPESAKALVSRLTRSSDRSLHAGVKSRMGGWRKQESAAGGMDQKDSNDGSHHLFPYRLVGCNSYFGDIEMIRSCPRLTTVRCETPTAKALILHKTDFGELRDQFPQFGALWQYAARRREWSRLSHRSRLTRGIPYRALAALKIERFWREWRTRGERSHATALELDGHADDISADFNQISRKQYINATAVRIMDKKDLGINDSHVEEEAHLRSRVDGLSEDMKGLREDVRRILQAVGLTPGADVQTQMPVRLISGGTNVPL